MKRNDEYTERHYRNKILKNNFNSFNVTIEESDLFISADSDLKDLAFHSLHRHRSFIEAYIRSNPDFLNSLKPLPNDALAPAIVREMIGAGLEARVGPMAAVAGAIADHVGADLLEHSRNVIVENGGDIFMHCTGDIGVGVFAGRSALSNRIALKIRKEEMPLGVCTSSGTVGHSLSFGKADAVCVKAGTACLADAAATAIGNRVKGRADIEAALEAGMAIQGVRGVLIVVKDQFGAIGDVEIADWS